MIDAIGGENGDAAEKGQCKLPPQPPSPQIRFVHLQIDHVNQCTHGFFQEKDSKPHIYRYSVYIAFKSDRCPWMCGDEQEQGPFAHE